MGITSWGIDCAIPGFPGVYAKVEKVMNWINYVTSEKTNNTTIISIDKDRQTILRSIAHPDDLMTIIQTSEYFLKIFWIFIVYNKSLYLSGQQRGEISRHFPEN